MFVRALGLVAGLSTAICIAPSAEACSPPLPGFGQVQPAVGALVPANAQILFNGYEFAPFSALWLDFDVFIPLTVDQLGPLGRVHLDSTAMAMAPDPLPITVVHDGINNIEPLQLRYRVQRRQADTSPPQATGPLTATWDYRESAPGLCEAGGYVVTLSAPAAQDDWGVSAYQLIEFQSPSAPERIVQTRLAPVDPNAPVTLSHHVGESPGRHCYGLLVHDGAGNMQRTQDALCVDVGTNPPLDAGLVDSGSLDAAVVGADAGRAPDARVPTSSGLNSANRGCACDSSSASGSAAWLAWIVGVFAWRRRSAAQVSLRS